MKKYTFFFAAVQDEDTDDASETDRAKCEEEALEMKEQIYR